MRALTNPLGDPVNITYIAEAPVGKKKAQKLNNSSKLRVNTYADARQLSLTHKTYYKPFGSTHSTFDSFLYKGNVPRLTGFQMTVVHCTRAEPCQYYKGIVWGSTESQHDVAD